MVQISPKADEVTNLNKSFVSMEYKLRNQSNFSVFKSIQKFAFFYLQMFPKLEPKGFTSQITVCGSFATEKLVIGVYSLVFSTKKCRKKNFLYNLAIGLVCCYLLLKISKIVIIHTNNCKAKQIFLFYMLWEWRLYLINILLLFFVKNK